MSRSVELHTLRRYYQGTAPRAGLIFGYGAADHSDIERGLGALDECFV